MTSVSKEEIHKLRLQGYSYRRIGQKLGFSHERIRQIDKDIWKIRAARQAEARAISRELEQEEREARITKYQIEWSKS